MFAHHCGGSGSFWTGTLPFCIVSNIGIKPVPTCIQENGSGERFCVAYLRFVDDDCVYDCSIYIPTLSYVQRACVH